MKRMKAKLTALLAVACCSVACLGFGLATTDSPQENVTAAAEVRAAATIHQLGSLAVHRHSNGTTANTPQATQLYIKTSITLPFTTWQDYFSLESGEGWKLNGEAITPTQFISADGFLFANLSNANVQVGDVLSVSGTFVHVNGSAKYVIEESQFTWNGTIWESYKEYTTYDIGALNFLKIGSSPNYVNDYIYLGSKNGTIPKPADGNNGWTAEFDCKDGVGVTLNGETIRYAVKYPGDMFINIYTAPAIGDVLTVGGTFSNAEIFTQYIVEESSFEWDGTTWLPCVEYTDFEIGALKLAGNQTSASSISLKRADGDTFDFANSTFTFRAKGGTGIRLNGEQFSTRTFTTTANEMSIALGVNAKEGDILTIGGKFYNFSLAAQYVIEDSSFIYENGVWKAYDSDYAQIGIGKVNVLADASSERYIYFVSEDESLKLPVDNWEDEFTCIFGVGATLNGETVKGTKIRSIDHTFYVSLGVKAQAGDVLSVGGKFVCDKQGVLYFVKEATFRWDGEAWTEFTEASANLSQWKDEAKARVDGYSSLEVYEAADQTKMTAIVDKAKADIDACTSAIKLNKIVNDAKAAMDKLVAPEEENNENAPDTEEESSGCGSVVGLTAGAMLAAACAAILLRKKKED